MKVLVAYDSRSLRMRTYEESLRCLVAHSKHDLTTTPGELASPCPPLSAYDAVVVHASLPVTWLSGAWLEPLRAFKGVKATFRNDEYDFAETGRWRLGDLQFDLVFTCVPAPYVALVYPPARFPRTRFVSVLTGYVPEDTAAIAVRPTAARAVVVGYRGRELQAWYGALGRQKYLVGVRMKAECLGRGVSCDIECDEETRIYGPAWYDFVASTKVTIGSESGSNVFDNMGEVRQAVQVAIMSGYGDAYDVVYAKAVAKYEGATGVRMNQISPRIFEAVALRTGLVLMRGEYSGVIEPDTHYIPIEHDFSNLDSVFRQIADDRAVQRMVDRTYDHVVGSGLWSYRTAVAEFDRAVEDAAGRAARGPERQEAAL